MNFNFKLNNKVNAILHLIWNFLITAMVISVTVMLTRFAFMKIESEFIGGFIFPIDFTFIFCMCLLMSVILSVIMIFSIINLVNVVKNNIALDERKAFAMKHMHIATFICSFLAVFSATVFPCNVMGIKAFVGILFVATIREFVYQAMLFVDNSNKEFNIKKNIVCLFYSLIGLPICAIHSVQLIMDLGLTPIFFATVDYPAVDTFYKGQTYKLNDVLVLWLIVVAVLLSIFIILSVFGLLKVIKGKRKQNITE